MANTRYCNNNNTQNNNGENKQTVNPSPPPLPTLEQVLAMQAQMLQTMQQTMVKMDKYLNKNKNGNSMVITHEHRVLTNFLGSGCLELILGKFP
jgi:hypothetical protein